MILNVGDVLYVPAASKTDRSCHAIEEGIVRMVMGHPFGARIQALNSGTTTVCVNEGEDELFRKEITVR